MRTRACQMRQINWQHDENKHGGYHNRGVFVSLTRKDFTNPGADLGKFWGFTYIWIFQFHEINIPIINYPIPRNKIFWNVIFKWSSQYPLCLVVEISVVNCYDLLFQNRGFAAANLANLANSSNRHWSPTSAFCI